MPRLVVVLPVEPLAVGASFAVAEWPLHVTVLAPFDTEAGPADVAAAIAGAAGHDGSAAASGPITAVAGSDALFGRREDVPVTLIDDASGAIALLHNALIAALRPLAASPHDPVFTGERFRPHVTVKGGRRVTSGDALVFTQIALVDMAPRSAPSGRSVLAVIPL